MSCAVKSVPDGFQEGDGVRTSLSPPSCIVYSSIGEPSITVACANAVHGLCPCCSAHEPGKRVRRSGQCGSRCSPFAAFHGIHSIQARTCATLPGTGQTHVARDDHCPLCSACAAGTDNSDWRTTKRCRDSSRKPAPLERSCAGVPGSRTMKAEQPVRISLSQLEADPHSLNDQINRALGSEPGCLGIVLIDGT